jgi:hypothetical protein
MFPLQCCLPSPHWCVKAHLARRPLPYRNHQFNSLRSLGGLCLLGLICGVDLFAPALAGALQNLLKKGLLREAKLFRINQRT